MNIGRVLAWIMIALAVAAAAGYGCQGDWRRAVYWFAAAVLQVTVTV